jgi:asparagine synthase (glutamine-hydrolysing)
VCGIVGVWSATALEQPDAVQARVLAMAEMVRHRGPDDVAAWSDGSVGLGYTRLAIHDLSPAASQPMVDPSGQVRLVFNGEVYNYVDLRSELTARGHSFLSDSDTEVLLHGYLEWGEAVLQRLRGMFAFAVWDGRQRRLLVARDRLGKKPLNYAWLGSTFLFGSEAKSILRWPDFPRRANLAGIDRFFLYRHVPGTDTAFEGVHRLEPAHYLTIDETGRVETHRYWELPEPASVRRVADRNALKEELLARLDDAVRVRMTADVPLGAFLSGGVDSSAVVASMALNSAEPVRTFTVGFRQHGIDERRHARIVAELYDTKHTEYVVEPDVLALSPSLAWFYGEPNADEATIPAFCISAVASHHVTVALNGDGGDENFFGYRRHAGMRAASWLDALPRSLRKALARGGGVRLSTSGQRSLRNIGKVLASAAKTPAERYAEWVTYGSDALFDAVATTTARHHLYAEAASRFEPYFTGAVRPDDATARADLSIGMSDELQVRIDIATMAHGLEGRSPFLDHLLVEWAAQIPARDKMHRLETKSLLREALLSRLPREVMYRPKQGLFMDFSFLDGQREAVRGMVLSPEARARGLFRPDGVKRLLDRSDSGDNRRNAAVWMLYVLEQWFQTWIDPPSLPLTPPPTPAIDA